MNTEQTATDKKMKTMTIELTRVDDAFHFEAASAAGVSVHLDGAPDIGGHNAGARPMELLLMGLAGCSAIDVVLILQKQRQRIDEFRITVEGDRAADVTPAPFEDIRLHYYLKGDISEEKARRAIDLSMDKYCSATAQLRPTSRISYELTLL